MARCKLIVIRRNILKDISLVFHKFKRRTSTTRERAFILPIMTIILFLCSYLIIQTFQRAQLQNNILHALIKEAQLSNFARIATKKIHVMLLNNISKLKIDEKSENPQLITFIVPEDLENKFITDDWTLHSNFIKNDTQQAYIIVKKLTHNTCLKKNQIVQPLDIYEVITKATDSENKVYILSFVALLARHSSETCVNIFF